MFKLKTTRSQRIQHMKSLHRISSREFLSFSLYQNAENQTIVFLQNCKEYLVLDGITKGCQSRGCVFESWLGQHGFRHLTISIQFQFLTKDNEAINGPTVYVYPVAVIGECVRKPGNSLGRWTGHRDMKSISINIDFKIC